MTHKTCNFATKFKYIKRLRHIFAILAWTLVGVYAIVVVLLHIPAVQHSVASETSKLLSDKLGTNVSIGNVNLGLLNRAIVDDLMIEDQQHRKMILCHRLSAKIDVISLLNGQINISSAQVFGMKALLVKQDTDSPLNIQFVLDSLASKDTTSHTPLDLRISSLVIRNTSVSYDLLDKPHKQHGFDINHLSFEKVSSHIVLYTLTDDSLSVRMKRLAFAELNSGFVVNDLSFLVNAGKNHAEVNNFNIITEHSDIALNAVANFSGKTIQNFSFDSNHSSISTHDLSCFIPQVRKLNMTVFVDANISGNNNQLDIKELSLHSSKRDLDINIQGNVSAKTPLIDAMKNLNDLTWSTKVDRLYASSDVISNICSALDANSQLIHRMGSVSYSGKASGSAGNILAQGSIDTGIGQLTHEVKLKNGRLNAKLSTGILKLGYLLDTDAIGDTELSADINGYVVNNAKANNLPFADANLKILFPQLNIKGYTYRNAVVEAIQQGNSLNLGLDIKDLNLNTDINLSFNNLTAIYEGKIDQVKDCVLEAEINHFNPAVLGITDKWPSTVFSANIKANVESLSTPLKGISATVTDFQMSGSEDNYNCNNISFNAYQSFSGEKVINLNSDFADISATGHFDPLTLPQSFTNLIAQKLPTLPGISRYKDQDNELFLDATIKRTDILQKVLGINITANETIDLHASVNDRMHITNISMNAPSLQCFGMDLSNTQITATSPGDTLTISAKTSKKNYDGSLFAINIDGKASNNNLMTTIGWHNGSSNDFRGSINAVSQFYKNKEGQPTAAINILPSEVLISDTLWNIHPSNISYFANHLNVDRFLVENGRQHISINGTATKNPNDSIIVDLHDINVGYIMNLIDFHSVEFNGYASGQAIGKALFSNPQAYTNIKVRNFLFENGRLGTLTAYGQWDNQLGQINIDAACEDQNVVPSKGDVPDFCSKADETLNGNRDEFVKIDGYISIKRSYIDLAIKATNARLEFLHTYTASFMDNLNAWATGKIRIFGPLSGVNMEGEATANGSVNITSLNTVYTIQNAYVKMLPDEIIFEQDTIYDKHGNIGLVTGALHHHNLARMTFDLGIEAKHLLCFDFPVLNNSTFCGYAVGTGNCKITGRSGEVVLDIDAYPEESSYILYDASSPDALQNQEFIQWRESPKDSIPLHIAGVQDKQSENADSNDDFRTNIHLNFLIHATPASTLRLLMDKRTGDYINLNGNGTLRAHYYNKGGMQIYGNYQVDHGEYKMTIQQVITKNFEFLPGGTITFAGEPFDAAIDLKAQYVVPSAPLSDLNIGNSFTSSTIKVNCLMNITGTAEHPVVDFDLNLPQASTDIQQMITSLMDSEEARNQQVIYLLAVGRFYSANKANDATSSQASLAMQSFLSGTVSQQLNNLISDVIIKNNNWNFGANISPGDEGMMNAEYEGLISGRMLNNRLLVNGQFGYRDNVNATTSFIGDFDVRYLLFPNGNLQVKVYNQTSDRYFTKSNLNTQGLGIILKHDFDSFIPYFLRKKKTFK